MFLQPCTFGYSVYRKLIGLGAEEVACVEVPHGLLHSLKRSVDSAGSGIMLASRYAIAVVLPLLLAACGGGTSTSVGPGPPGPAIGDLQDLRDAVSRFADNWAQRDGYSPPTLDQDGLAARDAEIARIADRAIRSDVLILDDDAEWSSAGAETPAASVGIDESFTPVGEHSGAELGVYTARWTTDPGHRTTVRLGWGAWLDRSRFGVVRDDNLLEEHGKRYGALHGYSGGQATRFLQEGGGATYRGIALAHRTSGSHSDLASRTGETPMARLLLGTATIEANFGYGTLDVAIHDLVDLAANAPSEIPGAAWRGIPISFGTMSRRSDTSSLSMSFYGDNGAEVGGVFRTDAMVGAFGARR